MNGESNATAARPARHARLFQALSLWRHHPLKLHIAVLFTALIVIACGVITASNYVQGRKLLLAAATDLIHRIDLDTSNELRQLFAPVETAVTLVSMAPAITGG